MKPTRQIVLGALVLAAAVCAIPSVRESVKSVWNRAILELRLLPWRVLPYAWLASRTARLSNQFLDISKAHIFRKRFPTSPELVKLHTLISYGRFEPCNFLSALKHWDASTLIAWLDTGVPIKDMWVKLCTMSSTHCNDISNKKETIPPAVFTNIDWLASRFVNGDQLFESTYPPSFCLDKLPLYLFAWLLHHKDKKITDIFGVNCSFSPICKLEGFMDAAKRMLGEDSTLYQSLLVENPS